MKRLLSAFAAVFVLVLIAKGSGALKEIAIAGRLGTSPAVDLYVLAFTVATWPAAVLLSILTISLTPLMSTAGARSDRHVADFVSQLLVITVALGIGVGGLFYFGFPLLVREVYQTDAIVIALAQTPMLISMSLTAALALPVALSTVLVIGKGRDVGTLLEGMPSLVLFLLLCSPMAAAEALGVGTALGFAVQLALLFAVQRATIGRFRFRLPAPNIHWSTLKHGASYSAVGYSVLAMAPIVEQTFAGTLGAGAISSLGYASRITALATGLVVTAINRVSLPYFSARSDDSDGPGVAQLTLGFLLVGITMTLSMVALAQPLVSTIFQRGQFSTDDTQVVAHLLICNLTQLAPYFVSVVLSARLAASGHYREIFVACVLGFAVRSLCAFAGARYAGLAGVAAAATGGYLAMSGYLSWATMSRLDRSRSVVNCDGPK